MNPPAIALALLCAFTVSPSKQRKLNQEFLDACFNGDRVRIQALVRDGADAFARDNQGRDACTMINDGYISRTGSLDDRAARYDRTLHELHRILENAEEAQRKKKKASKPKK